MRRKSSDSCEGVTVRVYLRRIFAYAWRRTMETYFSHKKSAQVAAILVSKEGGSINYMKLLKLMYLADRQALLEAGKPITGDQPVCMKDGLLLSEIYNLIKTPADSPKAKG